MTKIMITGGCGFIGVNLVELLLEKTDWNVVVLDNLSNGKLEDLKSVKNYSDKRIEFFQGDIRDEEKIQTIAGCDYVVNLAAQTGVIESMNNPLFDAEVNIIAIIKMLQLATQNNVKKFVHASSAAVLGDQEMPMHEQKVPQPLCPYGASKLAGEAYCSAFSASKGLNTVALRFSNVYGPKSYAKGSVIPKFIKQAMQGQKCVIYGDGEQTRDFVYVTDICNGIYLSLIKDLPNKYELIQLGTGQETSVNKFVQELKKVFEAEEKSVTIEHTPARAGEIFKNYTDISKAKKLLGFEPQVKFKEGLKETIEWFLENAQTEDDLNGTR